MLVNIDLNQVFHLHNTTKGPITVVYKKLPKKDISDVNAILEIDETDHVRSHKLFDNKSTDELFNMSTDIFVVDTPWLIERLEEEAPERISLKSCAMFFAIWLQKKELLLTNTQAT